MQNESMTYKDSGVDTEKGVEFIKNIKSMVASTHSKYVLNGLGGFAAAFDCGFIKDYKNPVLLSGTDGVGTKLEISRLINVHNTVGIDLVAMCVNDILVMGGKPLFFQDYISCGRLDIIKMESIIEGIVEGCKQSNVSLIGGETAEHPGIMKDDEYDLAGFVVGVVEKDDIIDGSEISEGDLLLGIESSGPHSNGFSLIRKLFLDKGVLPKNNRRLEVLVELAMKPTIVYVPYILELLKNFKFIKGMVHITGGGFIENIPRILKSNLGVELNLSQFPQLEFFEYLKSEFQLEDKVLYSTFNMGIGFVLVIPKEEIELVRSFLLRLGLKSYPIGQVIMGMGVRILS